MRSTALPAAVTALLLCAAAPRPAAAQERPDTAARAALPDVSFRARVTARTLRVDAAEDVSAKVWACPLADTVRVHERSGFPRPAQPGVTYRDVTVRVEYAAVLARALEDLLPAGGCSAARPDGAARPAAPRQP